MKVRIRVVIGVIFYVEIGSGSAGYTLSNYLAVYGLRLSIIIITPYRDRETVLLSLFICI